MLEIFCKVRCLWHGCASLSPQFSRGCGRKISGACRVQGKPGLHHKTGLETKTHTRARTHRHPKPSGCPDDSVLLDPQMKELTEELKTTPEPEPRTHLGYIPAPGMSPIQAELGPLHNRIPKPLWPQGEPQTGVGSWVFMKERGCWSASVCP